MNTVNICPPPVSDVATIPWAIHTSLFQQYCSHILLIIYVISEENKLNQLAHPT